MDICRFANVKASVKDAAEYLARRTSCGSDSPVVESWVERHFTEKKIKLFEPEPKCGGTPFYELFKPNPQTMVAQYRGVFFFMNREGSAGKADGTKQGS